MYYGLLDYYTLTFVGPRTRTRQPYPRSRRDRRNSIAGVTTLVPAHRATTTMAVSLAVVDGDKFRIRIQQIAGDGGDVFLTANSSSFNISK